MAAVPARTDDERAFGRALEDACGAVVERVTRRPAELGTVAELARVQHPVPAFGTTPSDASLRIPGQLGVVQADLVELRIAAGLREVEADQSDWAAVGPAPVSTHVEVERAPLANAALNRPAYLDVGVVRCREVSAIHLASVPRDLLGALEVEARGPVSTT